MQIYVHVFRNVCGKQSWNTDSQIDCHAVFDFLSCSLDNLCSDILSLGRLISLWLCLGFFGYLVNLTSLLVEVDTNDALNS